MRGVAALDPATFRVRQERLGERIESVDLVLAAWWQLGREPVDGLDGTPPLGRGALARIVEVAHADDGDDILVQHAGGDVQQNQNAPAAEPQTSDVLSLAAGLAESADLLTRRALEATAFEALHALLERADVRLELLDVTLFCEILRIEAGDILIAARQLGHEP